MSPMATARVPRYRGVAADDPCPETGGRVVDYATEEIARFVGACIAAGALTGLLTVTIRLFRPPR